MRGTKAFRTRIPRCGGRAFTLIELLVVISILVMLMALLLPTVERVRKQAKAVACQSNLRQWGVIFEHYTDDHDGYFLRPRGPSPGLSDEMGRWAEDLYPYYRDVPDLLRCPATTLRAWSRHDQWVYGLCSAGIADGQWIQTAYGLNGWVCDAIGYSPEGRGHPSWSLYWRNVRTATGFSRAPVFLDAIHPRALPAAMDSPPAVEFLAMFKTGGWTSAFCINRHNGCVNGLFMDWSARPVGVKELWTLKWHRKTMTTGPWTKAGGVQPEDWPPWMRRFKDY
jgi:prepilin-type N-terminal cleavage/methylation domain-containing protein